MATLGILYGFSEVSETGAHIWGLLARDFTTISAYSFLVFNLLCTPCFAAIGAIKSEMNNGKWTLFAVGYQTLLSYGVSLSIYQLGTLFASGGFGTGTAVALVIVAVLLYFLLRPSKDETLTRSGALSSKART